MKPVITVKNIKIYALERSVFQVLKAMIAESMATIKFT